jgi:hypothetical protein
VNEAVACAVNGAAPAAAAAVHQQHWAKLAMLGTVATVMAKFTVTSPRSMSVESLAAGEIFSLSITSKTPLKLSFTPRK